MFFLGGSCVDYCPPEHRIDSKYGLLTAVHMGVLLLSLSEKVLHKAYAAGDKGRELRDAERYMTFVRKHRGDTLFPGWKFMRGTLFGTPSVTKLNTIYNAGHDEVRGRNCVE